MHFFYNKLSHFSLTLGIVMSFVEDMLNKLNAK